MPTPPTVAYLTRHTLNDTPTLNVYRNGTREYAARVPLDVTRLAELSAWADRNLKENGYLRTGGWAQPDGWDKVLHDYKAPVIPAPAQFATPAGSTFTRQQAQQIATSQLRTRHRG